MGAAQLIRDDVDQEALTEDVLSDAARGAMAGANEPLYFAVVDHLQVCPADVKECLKALRVMPPQEVRLYL